MVGSALANGYSKYIFFIFADGNLRMQQKFLRRGHIQESVLNILQHQKKKLDNQQDLECEIYSSVGKTRRNQ